MEDDVSLRRASGKGIPLSTDTTHSSGIWGIEVEGNLNQEIVVEAESYAFLLREEAARFASESGESALHAKPR